MKNLFLIFPVLLLLLGGGCALLDRDGRVAPVRQFPPAAQKPSVCIGSVRAVMRAHGREQPVEGDLSGDPVHTTTDALYETFKNSGMYALLTRMPQPQGAAYTVNFSCETEIPQRSVGKSILFICTLGIFPLYDDRSYQMTATVVDNRSGLRKTVKLEESADYWFDTLLLPVGTLRRPAEVGRLIQKDLNDNMAIAVHEAILAMPPPEPSLPIMAPPSAASTPRPAAVAVPASVLRLTPEPVAAPVLSGGASGDWPPLVVKGTFAYNGNMLALLDDGATLESGSVSTNGVMLLDAAPNRVRMSYQGQVRTYYRTGKSFAVYTNETIGAIAPR